MPSENSPLEVALIPSLLAAMACMLEGRSLVRGMSDLMRLTLVPESARVVGRWRSEFQDDGCKGVEGRDMEATVAVGGARAAHGLS